MKATNAAGPTRANGLRRKMAAPTRMMARPRYIGLRVTRNTPLVTSDDAASILTGSIVVRWRRNSKAPAIPSNTPPAARPPPNQRGSVAPMATVAAPTTGAMAGEMVGMKPARNHLPAIAAYPVGVMTFSPSSMAVLAAFHQ